MSDLPKITCHKRERKRSFPDIGTVSSITRPAKTIEINNDVENGVLLRRFAHQVAGRSPMYCFDNETVCKPLNMREAEFYNSRGFPKRLQRFTPRYHGSTVAVCNGSDVIAINQVVTGRLSDNTHSTRESESGSSCSDDEDEDEIMCGSEEEEEEELSPWSAKIHQKSGKDTLQQKIELIMLENVTANHSKPCILDLKVGTCLWYPHDSYRKRQNHELKAKKSTSKSLGLRLHGSQIYDPTHDKYHYRDKFYGRKLTIDQLIETVCRFLDSADPRLRDGICGALVMRLIQLRNMIQSLDSFRFPGTSLLIIYDGAAIDRLDECHNSNLSITDWLLLEGLVDIRMIDFAKATYAGFLHEDENYTGPDEGYLYGLNHLISIIQKTIKNKSNTGIQ